LWTLKGVSAGMLPAKDAGQFAAIKDDSPSRKERAP
jgi:hypothetical protein